MSTPPKDTPAARSSKANQLSRGVLKTVAGMALTSLREFVALAAHAGDMMMLDDDVIADP